MSYLVKLRCPQCDNGGRVFRLSGSEPNAYRCYVCNLKFIVTNPSYFKRGINVKRKDETGTAK